MAQTTTAINACDAVLKLDSDAGVLTDISGSSNEVTMDLDNEIGKRHSFGSRFPIKKACKSDAKIQLKAIYSDADAEAMNILLGWYFNNHGTTRTFTVGLPAAAAGDDLFTFECFLKHLNIPGPSDSADPILVTVDLEPTGSYTWAVSGT